jgi:hypothetical protein
MKRAFEFAILTLITSTAAWAQPPEEVPPPPPEPVIEQLAPAVSPRPAPAPAVVPVAESAAPAKAPEEDKRVKGFSLAPYVGLYPIGFDSINISGTQGSRYFLYLNPGIDLSASFKTATDKTLDFSAGYNLAWREYYNKTTSKRDFQNEITANMKVQWTPLFSTSALLIFDHFIKSGPDIEADNGIAVELIPMMGFKVNPQLNFGVGYYMSYADSTSEFIGAGDATDPGFNSGPINDALSNYGGSAFDFLGDPTLDPTVAGDTRAFVSNRAVGSVSWSPIKDFKAGFEYRYEFAQFGNLAKDALTGHFIIPSVSQKLPFGTSISLKDELRIRKYKNTKVEGTDVARQNFRNRVTISVDQPITDWLEFNAYYRLQFVGENRDDYTNLTWDNWFYTGVKFMF